MPHKWNRKTNLINKHVFQKGYMFPFSSQQILKLKISNHSSKLDSNNQALIPSNSNTK